MRTENTGRSPEIRIQSLLLQRDFPALLDLCEKDRRIWRALRATLFHSDEELRWPAIEAVAKIMDKRWRDGHRESVKEYIRRLLWSLCDEAGEMGWSAPQTIAEIIACIPELIEPYGSMMIYRALEEPALVAGGLWGIGRLGPQIKDTIESMEDAILRAFRTGNAETTGVAAWAAGETGFRAALPCLESLRNRSELLRIYINSNFYRKSLGQWAQESIARITQDSPAK